MTRIFLYRLFWGIYDYLGTFAGVSFLGGITLWGISYGLLYALFPSSPLINRTLHVILGVLAVICFLWWVSASTLVGKIIANEESLRIKSLLGKTQCFFAGAIIYALTVAFGSLLMFVNIWFYSTIASQAGGASAMLASSVAILFIYLFICFFAYALALLGTWAVGRHGRFGKGVLREALMHLSMLPRLWFTALLLWLASSTLLAISVIGIVFVIPFWCAVGCVAFKTSADFINALTSAKAELGAEKPLKLYRRRAVEMCIESEMRKPPRTWKDIFKPWEF
ncbi:MAG: hypothetical protein N2Z21_04275 [Candidatus Sumerlaeaceae bacterium]|nr:hypothetical protein [Candidatus Sumerlaeaceae bacterium]